MSAPQSASAAGVRSPRSLHRVRRAVLGAGMAFALLGIGAGSAGAVTLTADDVPTTFQSSPVVVTLSPADTDGSGVGATYYTVGSPPAAPTTLSAVYSPFAQPVLADGQQISYFSVDGLGNPEAVRTSSTAKVDTVAPDTHIASAPDGVVSATSATPTFVGDDGGSGVWRYECELDGSGWSGCTSGATFSGLADGSHTFSVRAIDVAGNVDPTPASATWIVDSVAPDTHITTPPSDPTTATSATIAFAGDDGSGSGVWRYECRFDAGSWFPCTSAPSFSGLADGSHTFDVRAIDFAGNVDPTPASATWLVDTTPPDTTIDAGPLDPGNASSVSVAFSGTDAGSQVSSFECRLDSGAWTTCTSVKAYPGLADGTHTVQVRAYDGAHNVDPTPASRTFVIDTVAPTTTITSRPANPTASTNGNIGFTGSDDRSGVARYECRRDGGSWAPCTSVDAATAPEGDRTFDVRAFDHAGNVDASPAHHAWLVDLTDPNVSISSPAARTQDAYGSGDPRQLVRPFYPLHGGPPAYSCTDPLAGSPADASGMKSCTDDFDNETLGSHEFDVTAVDKVDHVTHSKNVTPRAYKIVPPKYDDFVEAQGPTAYWRLDDPIGSTTMAADRGPSGVHQNGVVLRRAPALKCEDWKNPKHHPASWCDPYNFKNQGYSAFYDGNADHSYVNDVPQAGSWDENGRHIVESFSADAWGFPIGDGNGHARGTLGLLSHGQEFEIYYDGRWHARMVNGTELVGPAQGADQWYHVGVTWDGGTVKLYVNGNVVDSRSGITNAWSGKGNKDTFFVGRTNISASAWWHGSIDEVAYYNNKVLSQHDMRDRWKIGALDEPGGAGHGVLDMTRPTADIDEPSNGATYNSNAKTLPNPPRADWSCDDPDGVATVTGCVATVDGSPISHHALLPLAPGTHDFKVVATNENGLTYEHHHTYVVKPFDQIVLGDGPEAYYRLDEPTAAHNVNDATGRHGGEYKNDTANGPVGISGDGNTTRSFLGQGGYAYVNGVPAGNLGYSVEAWVKPADAGDMAIFDHGAGGSAPALFLRGGHLVLHLPDGGPDPDSSRELVSPGGFPYDGGFHQVAATWDGVTAKLFIDGRPVNARETTRTPSGTSTLYIGFGNVGLWHNWFRGGIDEVSYYRTALTDQRILEHWMADPPVDDVGAPATPADPPADQPSGDPSGDGQATDDPAADPAAQNAAPKLAQPPVKAKPLTAKQQAAKKAAAKKAAAKKAAAKKAAAKKAAARRAAAKKAAAKKRAAATKRATAKRHAQAAKKRRS